MADPLWRRSGRLLDRPVAYTFLHRVCLYALGWLPLYGLMVFLVPRYGPIDEKFEQVGDLSQPARWFWAFARFDEARVFLPSLLAIILLLAWAEWIMDAARLPQRRRFAWAAAVACAGPVACGILVKALMLPVFRHPMPS